ncbi:MAG: hypothetical protein IPO19_03175 [Rhodoferax sp.]|nr:hypothetical protein [Rhodoferax sp.]
MHLIANLVTVVFLVLLMLAIASASAHPPTAHVIRPSVSTLPSSAPAGDPQLSHDADASAPGLISSALWR